MGPSDAAVTSTIPVEKKHSWQGNLFSDTSTAIFVAASSFLVLKYVFFPPLLFDVEARANGFRNSVTLKEKTPLI